MSCSQSCAARCLSREASVTCGCVVTCSGEIPQRRIASRVASQSACSGGQSKGRATTAPDCGQYVRRSIEKPCSRTRAAADATASSSDAVTRCPAPSRLKLTTDHEFRQEEGGKSGYTQ